MAETKKKETREQLILVTLAALWECYWGNLSHRLLSRLILKFAGQSATSALETRVVSRGQKTRNADTLLQLLYLINR